MGLMDLYAAQAGVNEPPLQALPRSLGERVEATAAQTFAPDRYFMITGARRDAWQRSVDDLHSATGQTFANPYGPVTPEEMTRLGNQPAVELERRQKIIDASRAERAAGNDDLYDPENIDRYIGEEATRRRQTAASYEGTGNGFGNFLAGAALSTLEPINVLTLGVPVSRLPMAAASAIGRSFFGNVAREAALQAGVNVAAQGATEALDYASRSETGTAQTPGEIGTDLAVAAGVGAVLGGGVRALHLKWLGLPEKVRANAPLEVRDAFRAIEADSIYSGQNRLGVDPMLHERYQGNAMDAVMRGKPVDLAELGRTADTPMTALGTILRSAPDSIQARGLPDVLAHLESLPDSEIAAFAREVKPTSFARLDKVEGQMSDLQGRLAEIDQRTPSIHDMVDPDTSMRLQAIEEDLQAPGLRAKERRALEDERETIAATVDPKGRLPAEAAKAQRVERAKIEQQIAKLEPTRTEARATADAATADLRRKLGRYADLASPAADVSKDLGFNAPADLAQAVARADVMRQARMVREIMPEGPAPNFKPEAGAPKPAEEITPEATKALETETKRLMEEPKNAAREVSVDGKTMKAALAMEEADRMARDAQVALGCAMGSI